MKFPNWFRILWWALLLLGLAAFLYGRRQDLLAGRAGAFDVTAFVVWAALLLAPVFAEVTLFGLAFKQQIEKLQATVKDTLTAYVTEVRTLSVQTRRAERGGPG